MAKFILEIDDKITPGFENFKKANVIGIRNTLNVQAGLTRRNAIRNVQDEFILRNRFTKSQVQFEKTNSSIISTMESRAGATKKADYMKLQELGGQRPDFDGRTAIGQKKARVGGSSRKPVSRPLYMQRVKKKIVKGPFKKNYKTSKSKMVASMAVAEKKKLFIKRGDNVYRVISFYRSGRNNIKARLQHLYNIQTKPIHIDAEPWLLPATVKPARDGHNIYKSEMKKLWRDGKIK